MGWGRTLLLGDIGNRLDIADSEEDIRRLRAGLQRKELRDLDQDERLEALAKENEQLKLYLVALLRLLVKKRVLSSDELSSFVALIDEDPPSG
jgi:hypothetical protein